MQSAAIARTESNSGKRVARAFIRHRESTNGLRHDSAVITRLAMLLVAAVAIVVLGLWYANARDLNRAADVSLHTTSPASRLAAQRLFERARRLSPDTSPEIGRA